MSTQADASSIRLYVGGLPADVQENELFEIFSQFGGRVLAVDIIRDRMSGRCKGIAYVNLEKKANILKCIHTLHNSKWKRNVLKVEIAKPDWLTRRQEELQERARQALKSNSNVRNEPPFVEVEKPSEEWSVVKHGVILPILRLRDEKCGNVTFNPNHYNNTTQIRDSDETTDESESNGKSSPVASSPINTANNTTEGVVSFDTDTEYTSQSPPPTRKLNKGEIPSILQDDFDIDNKSKEESEPEDDEPPENDETLRKDREQTLRVLRQLFPDDRPVDEFSTAVTCTNETSSAQTERVQRNAPQTHHNALLLTPAERLLGDAKQPTVVNPVSFLGKSTDDKIVWKLLSDRNSETPSSLTTPIETNTTHKENSNVEVLQEACPSGATTQSESKDAQMRSYAPLFLYLSREGDHRIRTLASQFMRTQTLEEIETEWRHQKQYLTEDFKKKHNRAMKRKRKLDTVTN
jgi:hypothetical protein